YGGRISITSQRRGNSRRDFEWHSHFDVMTRYWKYQGWGEYKTEHSEDYQPFPEQWLHIQRSHLSTAEAVISEES
ncbi:hypothetical protein ACI0FS_04010, partial [Ochrobactrum quorumnocens]